jgi:hypothetical protein
MCADPPRRKRRRIVRGRDSGTIIAWLPNGDRLSEGDKGVELVPRDGIVVRTRVEPRRAVRAQGVLFRPVGGPMPLTATGVACTFKRLSGKSSSSSMVMPRSYRGRARRTLRRSTSPGTGRTTDLELEVLSTRFALRASLLCRQGSLSQGGNGLKRLQSLLASFGVLAAIVLPDALGSGGGATIATTPTLRVGVRVGDAHKLPDCPDTFTTSDYGEISRIPLRRGVQLRLDYGSTDRNRSRSSCSTRPPRTAIPALRMSSTKPGRPTRTRSSIPRRRRAATRSCCATSMAARKGSRTT